MSLFNNRKSRVGQFFRGVAQGAGTRSQNRRAKRAEAVRQDHIAGRQIEQGRPASSFGSLEDFGRAKHTLSQARQMKKAGKKNISGRLMSQR